MAFPARLKMALRQHDPDQVDRLISELNERSTRRRMFWPDQLQALLAWLVPVAVLV